MPRGRSGRRTDYAWLTAGGVKTALDLAVASADILVGRLDFASPGTLTRVRGVIHADLDAGGADERAIVAVGLIIVKQVAATAGIASVPTPFTEGSAPWLWHGYLPVSAGAGGTLETAESYTIEIDAKAMRRLKPDDSLIMVAEVAMSVDATGTVDLMWAGRALIGT